MMLATVDVQSRRGRVVRLWLPLFLVWLLLAPILLILSPLIVLGLLICRLNPFTAIASLVGLLAALSGTRVEVDGPDARVHIRLF